MLLRKATDFRQFMRGGHILRMKVSWVSSASHLSRDVNGGEVSKCDRRIFYFPVSGAISRAFRQCFAQ